MTITKIAAQSSLAMTLLLSLRDAGGRCLPAVSAEPVCCAMPPSPPMARWGEVCPLSWVDVVYPLSSHKEATGKVRIFSATPMASGLCLPPKKKRAWGIAAAEEDVYYAGDQNYDRCLPRVPLTWKFHFYKLIL